VQENVGPLAEFWKGLSKLDAALDRIDEQLEPELGIEAK
jgi:hypothetical protein